MEPRSWMLRSQWLSFFLSLYVFLVLFYAATGSLRLRGLMQKVGLTPHWWVYPTVPKFPPLRSDGLAKENSVRLQFFLKHLQNKPRRGSS